MEPYQATASVHGHAGMMSEPPTHTICPTLSTGSSSGGEEKKKKRRRLQKYKGETDAKSTNNKNIRQPTEEAASDKASKVQAHQEPGIFHQGAGFQLSNNNNTQLDRPLRVLENTDATSPSASDSNHNYSKNEDCGRTNSNIISYLGSREQGLAVIPPDESQAPGLGVLKRLNKVLKSPRVRRELDRFVEKEIDLSARRIQAGRYEIFVHAQSKPSTAFDEIIVPLLPHGAKKTLLKYARRQARRDTRLQVEAQSSDEDEDQSYAKNSKNYSSVVPPPSSNKRKLSKPVRNTGHKFGTFSLIVSFDAVPAQAPHIDLVPPNFQFGLLVSDECPGTMVYETPTDARVQNLDDLVRLWSDIMRQKEGIGSVAATDDASPQPSAATSDTPIRSSLDVPKSIVLALENDDKALDLLKSFGNALPTDQRQAKSMRFEPRLAMGSCLSLPGGVVHAGPECHKFRAVLFFSAYPHQQEESQYDPDVQYTGLLLCGHLISILWTRQGIGYNERLWMLRLLAIYVEESTVKSMWGHFGAGELSSFVRAIETKQFGSMRNMEEFIEQTARSTGIAVPGDPWSQPVVIDVTTMKLVSTPNLYTIWDGAECTVLVYRRCSDNKIILRYPQAGDNPDEYEGNLPGDDFTLEFFESASIPDNGQRADDDSAKIFDGNNGVVRATDGEVISFTVGPYFTVAKRPPRL